MAVIYLEEPRVKREPPRGLTPWALGFRPFYLLAALLAVLAVPTWVAALLTGAAKPTVLWHAHEMVFGFAAAVITGFLFTAVKNWTGRPTPTGKPLAALALLWVLGRIATWVALNESTPSGVATWAALIDVAFLPCVALILGRILWLARSQRNYFVVVLLLALSGCNIAFHGRLLGWPFSPDAVPLIPLHLAIALITMLETVIAGRIVPGFTANALKTVKPWQHPWLNWAAIGTTALALLAWAADLTWRIGEHGPLVLTVLAGTAAVLQTARCAGWQPQATLRTPLLWILHVSHGWIIIAMVLMACRLQAAALHVLTVGAMAGLILGMITRTALGHTGRLLLAGPFETWAYRLLVLAVLARAVAALIPAGIPPWTWADALTAPALVVAAAAWSLAFGLYLWKYVPILLRPRPDGRDG
ncbi:NnrS family protein [Aquabacterium sp.]|uniref:NnrS family protein n=1 Tax=Aquabacterium sp. TaxID=1872578 RepID=UPI0035ADA94F